MPRACPVINFHFLRMRNLNCVVTSMLAITTVLASCGNVAPRKAIVARAQLPPHSVPWGNDAQWRLDLTFVYDNNPPFRVLALVTVTAYATNEQTAIVPHEVRIELMRMQYRDYRGRSYGLVLARPVQGEVVLPNPDGASIVANSGELSTLSFNLELMALGGQHAAIGFLESPRISIEYDRMFIINGMPCSTIEGILALVEMP